MHDAVLTRWGNAEVTHVWLWVFQENQRARRFYTKHGWNQTAKFKNSNFAPYPVMVKYTRSRWPTGFLATYHAGSGYPSGRRTNPVFSLGVKNVDLGGISRPSRAVRSISGIDTGRISTAAVAAPLATAATASSKPC